MGLVLLMYLFIEICTCVLYDELHVYGMRYTKFQASCELTSSQLILTPYLQPKFVSLITH